MNRSPITRHSELVKPTPEQIATSKGKKHHPICKDYCALEEGFIYRELTNKGVLV